MVRIKTSLKKLFKNGRDRMSHCILREGEGERACSLLPPLWFSRAKLVLSAKQDFLGAACTQGPLGLVLEHPANPICWPCSVLSRAEGNLLVRPGCDERAGSLPGQQVCGSEGAGSQARGGSATCFPEPAAPSSAGV